MSECICPKCQYVGKPARKKRGSAKIEFGGWMVFPLGLPYTIWRMLSKISVCKHCGHDLLIPVNSVVGKKLMAKYNEDPLPELAQRDIKNNIKNNALLSSEVALSAMNVEEAPAVAASSKPIVW